MSDFGQIGCFMIICKNCRQKIEEYPERCPSCGAELRLSARETAEIVEKIAEARQSGDSSTLIKLTRFLADLGHTDSEREMGRMLESGGALSRDYNEAMRYFGSAARKNDPYSAYRYSRLIARGNETTGNFWLLFAAVIGCPDAFAPAAELLASRESQEDATHFYRLAANGGDADAIVEMAKRYHGGIGTEQSSEHAKWYMDKLRHPPLYAFMLTRKIRGAIAKEPHDDAYDPKPLLEGLARDARRFSFNTAYLKIMSLLSAMSDLDSMLIYSSMLIDGVGGKPNLAEAVRILTEAATIGSAEAYLCLGDLYMSEGEMRDVCLAAHYYEIAGKHGVGEGYEKLGDIYERGEEFKRDYSLAEKYYSLAVGLGASGAKEKAEAIREKREKFFSDGEACEKENPTRAFRAYAIAAAMGHPDGAIKLAECYLGGIGTEVSRRSAFIWFSEAMKNSDERAAFPLGFCYSRGIGTDRDFKKAKEYLLIAAKLGSVGAKKELSKILEAKKKKMVAAIYSRAMRLIHKKKFTAAKECLELASELSHAVATYTLGCMHEFGLGDGADRRKAYPLYDEAAKLGFVDERSSFKAKFLKSIR